MIEATLKAKPQGCWIITFLQTHPEVRMTVIDCKVLEGSKGVHHLFEIVAPPHLIDRLAESIRNDPSLYGIELITSQKGRIYGSIKIHDHICGFSNMQGLYLRSVSSMLDGTVEWNILGNSSSLQRLLKELDSEGVPTEVIRMASFNGASVLTARQELTLKMAFERGYFDYPKKIHLEELAKITGTTPAALTEILRKGVSKVLREYFDNGSSGSDNFRLLK